MLQNIWYNTVATKLALFSSYFGCKEETNIHLLGQQARSPIDYNFYSYI